MCAFHSSRRRLAGLSSLVIVAGLFQATLALRAEEKPVGEAQPQKQSPAKPISDFAQKGLAYLVSQQDDSGGWGQGGGWRVNTDRNGRVEGPQVNDRPDLGNTCIATLALIRAGNTPTSGPYAKQVAKAAEFICKQVEQAEVDGLYVTSVRDTQLQQKIGQYADTFLAGLVLSELKGKLPAGNEANRVLAALDKTVKKIENNQKQDGTFAGNGGWATVLSQGLASKFINRAAQSNVAVKSEVLDRDFQQSLAALAPSKAGAAATTPAGTPSASATPAAIAPLAGPGLVASGRSPTRVATSGRKPAGREAAGDAGVDLYFFSSNAGRLSDYRNTNGALEESARKVLADKDAPAEAKQKAQADVVRFEQVKTDQKAAVRDLVARLGDDKFIAGFGNNGGEEFLSYMNISEMLLAQGGNEWQKWDQSVTKNLEKVQNGDGSWSGQHCITGRTFCTSAALLTLLADRAPVPLAAQIQQQKDSQSTK